MAFLRRLVHLHGGDEYRRFDIGLACPIPGSEMDAALTLSRNVRNSDAITRISDRPTQCVELQENSSCITHGGPAKEKRVGNFVNTVRNQRMHRWLPISLSWAFIIES